MNQSPRLVDQVDARIVGFLESRSLILRQIAPELAPFDTFSRDLLSGGKRFRAQFCYWGWRAAGGLSAELSPAVVDLCAGLELFHAAALVHDDIIDRSDTRRGMPAAHRRFESVHRDSSWEGDAAGFGEGAAILLGDLLLAWSDELVSGALAMLPDTHARGARQAFDLMRTEVTLGQYLDIMEERAWRAPSDLSPVRRAERVMIYKSAKYSVEAPLAIGASAAGGRTSLVEGLRDVGLPLGIAFQLRDDVLGVFGDAEVTGKPSGDDLREGKRTLLVAYTRARLSESARRLVDELLGDPDLDESQVRMLQQTMREAGALDEAERLIEGNVALALENLGDLALDDETREALVGLARRITDRVA
ncbi:polyprenyl synthetase family protein [Cnuibacter sp. UC19_7]|uniref:polyprenyl synthetase family protein n=1 Tax=Cnuibacter sp. UC19_7 TaxID=3350166 RepID=UPI003671A462